MIDPTEEHKYWEKHHSKQPYADEKIPFEHFAPAYRLGIEAALEHPDQPFEEIEQEVSLGYQRGRIGAALPWDHARHAVHASWAKLSGDLCPRDPERGMRGGI